MRILVCVSKVPWSLLSLSFFLSKRRMIYLKDWSVAGVKWGARVQGCV